MTIQRRLQNYFTYFSRHSLIQTLAKMRHKLNVKFFNILYFFELKQKNKTSWQQLMVDLKLCSLLHCVLKKGTPTDIARGSFSPDTV